MGKPTSFLWLYCHANERVSDSATVEFIAILSHQCYRARLHSLGWYMADYFMVIWVIFATNRVHLLKAMFGKYTLQFGLYEREAFIDFLQGWIWITRLHFCSTLGSLLQDICYLHKVPAETLDPYRDKEGRSKWRAIYRTYRATAPMTGTKSQQFESTFKAANWFEPLVRAESVFYILQPKLYHYMGSNLKTPQIKVYAGTVHLYTSTYI